MKRIVLLLALTALFLLMVHSAQAMVSTNYTLDWFTPLVGPGGSSSSAHYAIHLTVGQTVIGGQQSTNYKSGLGFWYGRLVEFNGFMPVVRKN